MNARKPHATPPSDGRLHDGGEINPVHECGQIIDQLRDMLGRRRHEVGAARIEGISADPVLPVPELSGDAWGAGRFHEHAVEREDVACPERFLLRAESHRFFHRGDISKHRARGLVPGCGSFSLGFRQATLREHQTFDPGRCDRFCAQQTPGEHFQAGHRRRVAVEEVDLPFGGRDHRRDLGGQGELPLGQRVGYERLIMKRLTLSSASSGERVGRPGALNQSRHITKLDQAQSLVKVYV